MAASWRPRPFRSTARELSCAGARSIPAYMAGQPVAGVAVWAHTGRGLMLDASTAERVLRDWRDVLPDRLVVAGVGAPPTADPSAATAAPSEWPRSRAARRGRAPRLRALVASRPRGRDRRSSSTTAARRLGLPLVLFYLYEGAGGIGYAPRSRRAARDAGGRRHQDGDARQRHDVPGRRAPDRRAASGEAAHHRRGSLPRLQPDVRRARRPRSAWARPAAPTGQPDRRAPGRRRALPEPLAAVDVLAEATFVRPMEGYIRRMLWVLVHQGVIPAEAAHDPWGPELPQASPAVGACSPTSKGRGRMLPQDLIRGVDLSAALAPRSRTTTSGSPTAPAAARGVRARTLSPRPLVRLRWPPRQEPFRQGFGPTLADVWQVRRDADAGLGFVVLKTIIAEDQRGGQSMSEWAIPETRMVVEPITGADGPRAGP